MSEIKTSETSTDLTDVNKKYEEDDFNKQKPSYDDQQFYGNHFSYYLGKLVQSFTGRVLDWDDNNVKVEVLTNMEKKLFEVRFFPIEVFNKSHLLEHGKFLRIMLYLKNKEMSFLFEDGKNFVASEMFPNKDFFSEISDSNLFKFK